MNHAGPLIRISSLARYRELVRELGGHPEAFLREFNIAPELLDVHHAMIPMQSMVQLFELTASQLDCADFGLRLSAQQDWNVIGPVSLIARNAPDVGAALDDFARFVGFYSAGTIIALDRTDPAAPRLTYRFELGREITRHRQTVERALGVMHNTMALLLDDRAFHAQAVLFRHGAALPLQRYRKHFKTNVLFGQEVDGLVLHPAQIIRPISQHNRMMREFLIDFVSSAMSRHPRTVRELVTAAIDRLLPTGRCTLHAVAEQLARRERTLQRQLANEGVTFEQVVDAVRRDWSESYLAELAMPIAQIAGLLGYGEQSSYNRACRRWFGQTPLERRRALLG
ncbi:AraC family transcriptional regulator ligand-binding domain-containing protein [Lysobacter arenosi]|uniref:AraC family transcriptional regulator ligand-binding domain-containing protein n=1 Tax=Lysobacter arenosi TaxID=2795387 RepID=A0ABX7R8L8_9GAMM|nr:AraC family transcriptional regulator ligand-binding domain-containing protein [Lysobacter arenosi]QSX74450.1 AraC family transcriptional regulator ligand-binding domain-containing protein [Lysobacter arenosi]